MPSLITLSVASLLFCVLLVQYARPARQAKGTKLLPGPRGKPLVGNLLDIPPIHSWIKFKQWADQFGPIYRVDLAGATHVIVSSESIANDLLRERGNIYSSREQLPMAAQLVSNNLRPLLLPYNDVWRRGRKLMHHLTMSTVATSYEPTQILESARLLHDLILDPVHYERWFERYASGLILRLGFGKKVETGEEEHVRRIIAVVHNLERVASPGAYLVDVLPSLMWLPKWLAPFKQEGERLHNEELSLFRELLNDVRVEVAQGTAGPSFTKTWLERKEDYGLSDDEAAYVVGTLFEAGSGTTSAAMMSWVLCMVLHPEWMKKLQQETDKVVGDDRLPNFDDIPNLPTVRAVVKETMRWRPVTAGGLPHELTRDDIYNDFFLPAGTKVHAIQWAIHRDPTLYPSPEEFKPERWLDASYPTYREPLSTYPNLQNYSAFGFGRRICPGQNIAERSLHLLVARIAWACDIYKKRDDQGNEITPPDYDYVAGFNTQPNWFAFDLKARSTKRRLIVEDAYEDARRTDSLRDTKVS